MSDMSRELAPLETFDPRAFDGDSNVPQYVCSFVLTLALIHNDCNDGIDSYQRLRDSKPPGSPSVSRAWGSHMGAVKHYFRAHCGLIYELLMLISANARTIEHPFFVSVIKRCPPRVRNSWDALVDAAREKPTSSPLNSALLRIRNKVSFHYDPKEIYKGYRHHFEDAGSDEQAFVSRGGNMKSSRLYFADAAAEGCLKLHVEDTDVNSLMDLTKQLNHKQSCM